MPQVVKSLDLLDLDVEKIDGVSFMKSSDPKHEKDPDMSHWAFAILTLSENADFEKHELGYKFMIVLYAGNTAEVFEAILGDLGSYVKGMVKRSQEGIIVKKSAKGLSIMNKIFHGKYAESLLAGEVTVVSTGK